MPAPDPDPDPFAPRFHGPLPDIPDDAYRVLLTGFGPFFRYRENPSWLAARPLNNVTFHLDPSPDRMVEDDLPPPANGRGRARLIHITSLQLPVTYQAVLDCGSGFHARPPVLPPSSDPSHPLAPPPEAGYDFIFHLGLAGRGPLRMERLAHKIGYRMKDTAGQHAPIVDYLPDPATLEQSQAEVLEHAARLAAFLGNRVTEGVMDVHGPLDAIQDSPTRGFGKGYESFVDDMFTAIDVEKLVYDLKEQGIDTVYSSMDAGHYVNDFLYYCSLAEARRTATKHDRTKLTRVLFMHCPPAGQPVSTQEVIDAVKKIIFWVCKDEDTIPPVPPLTGR